MSSEELQQLRPIPCTGLMAEALLSMIQSMTGVIKQLERAVSTHCVKHQDYQLLNSIGGVGEILGATIALETGNIQRFPDAGYYLSYARCIDTRKISNGKAKGRNNRKNGNRYLALAFMQAAHLAIIWKPKIKRFYQKKQAKAHTMIAKKAVAEKLTRAIYHTLNKQEPFDVERAFG